MFVAAVQPFESQQHCNACGLITPWLRVESLQYEPILLVRGSIFNQVMVVNCRQHQSALALAKQACHAYTLHIRLLAAACSLSGTLSPYMGTVNNLVNIRLGNNSLRGTIPGNVTTNSQMLLLELQDNPLLYGTLPDVS